MSRKKLLKNVGAPSDDAKPETAIAVVERFDVEPTADLAKSIEVLPAGPDGARTFAEAFNAKFATTLRRTTIDLYDLGLALNAAHAARLHDRLGLTWEAFLDEHFDVSRSAAFKLQRNTELFTREQIEALGSKADELAPLSPEQREKLLPEATKMTVRALRAAVAKVKSPTPSTPAKGGTEAPGVSIGLRAETTYIPMTKLGDDAAVGVLACMNGRALQFALSRRVDGALQMFVTPIGGE